MDVDGFKKHIMKKTKSQASIQFQQEIVLHFEYIMRTFFEVEDIDEATEDHLMKFGKWTVEEGIIPKFKKSYERYVSEYYNFKIKPKLARVAEKGFVKNKNDV